MPCHAMPSSLSLFHLLTNNNNNCRRYLQRPTLVSLVSLVFASLFQRLVSSSQEIIRLGTRLRGKTIEAAPYSHCSYRAPLFYTQPQSPTHLLFSLQFLSRRGFCSSSLNQSIHPSIHPSILPSLPPDRYDTTTQAKQHTTRCPTLVDKYKCCSQYPVDDWFSNLYDRLYIHIYIYTYLYIILCSLWRQTRRCRRLHLRRYNTIIHTLLPLK
jgi:hypothetical protein